MKHHISFDLEFKKNSYSGFYIALEGIDGSGKTTQVEKIVHHFRSQGKLVVQTREPRNDGVVGSLIRKILSGKLKVSAAALQYLYSADRAIHQEEIVIPSLKEGKVVISDRCFWSAIPYGILDRSKDYNIDDAELLLVTQGILSMYHQFITPDQTFYLQISLETAMKRISKEAKEIYEEEGKLRKVIKGYEWLAEKFPDEIRVVDGSKTVDEVTEEVVAKLLR